ncbi:MAG: class I SAM-dependent methyltransferase [Chitinispirillia bacterium]|jgi:demethylmenaquinone methyltransferase/2-methoxy-6-polyprenyl-1,4-benzoquinol methylase
MKFIYNPDLSDPQKKINYNKDLFSTIAPHYATATKVLSFWQDAKWKDILISSLPQMDAPVIVDLACGTGDFILRLQKKYEYPMIYGIDITDHMIEQFNQRHDSNNIKFLLSDISDTGLKCNSVDIVTGGYALRNSSNLLQTLDEIYRILKPGGYAAFLDFSKSPAPFFRSTQYLLLFLWGILWSLLIHKKLFIYTYITNSLYSFPNRLDLKKLVQKKGFSHYSSRLFFCGFIELITFRK